MTAPLPTPTSSRCYIDGKLHGTPTILAGEPPLHVSITDEEFARVPLHIATVGTGSRVKRVDFPPTYLSDRFPQATRVYLTQCSAPPSHVLKAKAMPYIKRGLPVPAGGARWMALPVRTKKQSDPLALDRAFLVLE
jgi:hypothetical protein